jgi:hypothetical protein
MGDKYNCMERDRGWDKGGEGEQRKGREGMSYVCRRRMSGWTSGGRIGVLIINTQHTTHTTTYDIRHDFTRRKDSTLQCSTVQYSGVSAVFFCLDSQ